MKSKGPKRSDALRVFLHDMTLRPVQRYVEVQRTRERLITIGDVDIDVDEVVARRFYCDQHRCIHWTPHEKQAYAQATGELFVRHGSNDEADDHRLPCLIDQDASYEPLYQATRGIIEQLFGAAFYAELDRQAKKLPSE